jgi:hypothetical protein
MPLETKNSREPANPFFSATAIQKAVPLIRKIRICLTMFQKQPAALSGVYADLAGTHGDKR